MRYFLIAGEASGDGLGSALMAGLKSLDDRAEFSGVGGPRMQAEGLTSLFPMDELSVMGIAEILPRLRSLMGRVRQSADAVIETGPDALITIDSPDFCLRVARRVKAARADLRLVHYVAPSVWAWRPGRAAKMAEVIDQVLTLLPFEPTLMEAAGMRADFVGHPAVVEPASTSAEIAEFRARHGLGTASPLILALPGSRRAEVARLAETFGQTLARVAVQHPDVRVIVPTTEGVAAMLAPALARWHGHPVLLDPRGVQQQAFASEKRTAFAAADAALAASGTVSLELAAAGTPMVIAYDMNWFSRTLIGRLLKVDTVTLVNLVTESRTVPEFLGANCRADLIAPALLHLLDHPDAQRSALATTVARLGGDGPPPGQRAAQAVIEGLTPG